MLLTYCGKELSILSESTDILLLSYISNKHVSVFRNGVVRFESVMKMRNALDELGKMEGITEKEKGIGSL